LSNTAARCGDLDAEPQERAQPAEVVEETDQREDDAEAEDRDELAVAAVWLSYRCGDEDHQREGHDDRQTSEIGHRRRLSLDLAGVVEDLPPERNAERDRGQAEGDRRGDREDGQVVEAADLHPGPG
jgi:hypothetical protein